MKPAGPVLDRLRQPAYTGANRCIPCTIANSAIAVAVAVAVAGVTLRLTTPARAGAAGMGVLLVSASAIWLRGYLIPGTPTLTKRYMPPWMLRLFGKAPVAETPRHVDAESILVATDILIPCEETEGLCLRSAFHEQWAAALREADGSAELLSLLGTTATEDSLTQERPGGALVISGPHQQWGQWPSTTAIQADVATARVLRRKLDGWGVYHPVDRAALLRAVRIRLGRCPGGEDLSVNEETVPSCCGDHDVIAVECTGTGDRLVEERLTQV